MFQKTKHYGSRQPLIAIVVAIITLVATWIAKHADSASWVTILLLLIGTLPVVYCVGLVAYSLRQQDELHQHIQREAFMFAFAGTIILTYAYGALEDTGHVPHLSWALIFPLMTFIWLISLFIAQRRYQ